MAPTMALSKAEQNALCVSYDVLGTHVELDLQFVKRYLVRGNPDKITDQEIVFFMNTCKMQKLNPLVAGEVYCIKFGNDRRRWWSVRGRIYGERMSTRTICARRTA